MFLSVCFPLIFVQCGTLHNMVFCVNFIGIWTFKNNPTKMTNIFNEIPQNKAPTKMCTLTSTTDLVGRFIFGCSFFCSFSSILCTFFSLLDRNSISCTNIYINRGITDTNWETRATNAKRPLKNIKRRILRTTLHISKQRLAAFFRYKHNRMQTEKHIHTHTNTHANTHTCSRIHINTVTHTKMRFKYFFFFRLNEPWIYLNK